MKAQLKWSERPSRKELVSAQFDTPQAPAEYARVNEGFLPAGRFSRSRLRLVQDILASHPGGDLLDAGCGPGVMVRALLESRPNDFRIAALDRSLAMVDYCTARAHEIGKMYPATGQLEAMPFADASFDFTLVMGALEYTDARKAIHEIARVTRPDGLVIVSMLNPFSPYRLTEWFLLWPLVRALGAIQRYGGVPAERRHGILRTGIHALRPSRLRSLMRQVGLQPIDIVYFDVTPTLPPFDRLPGMVRRAERTPYERTVTRGWRRWMGSGYLIVATRSCTAAVVRDRAANRNH
jgi:ubiquinone/menaquinone biosynthesis C-methylase UbiE